MPGAGSDRAPGFARSRAGPDPDRRIHRWIDGELSGAEERVLEGHVRVCPGCRALRRDPMITPHARTLVATAAGPPETRWCWCCG